MAKTHGIVTPYTSYLILEDEQRRLQRGDIRPSDATLSQIAARNRDLEETSKKEYRYLAQKTGAASVQASREVQELAGVANVDQSRPGEKRLGIQGGSGGQQSLGQLVKNAAGRAFYQVEKFWIDSRLAGQQSVQVQRLQFASPEYFKLLRENPALSSILALGPNLRFVWQNQIVEISE